MDIEKEILEIKIETIKIKNDVHYIKKMLEDMTLGTNSNDPNINNMQDIMKTLTDTILNDPGVGQQPEVQNIIKKMYDSVIPKGGK